MDSQVLQKNSDNENSFSANVSFTDKKNIKAQVLAPVSNDEMLQAAIHNGADAVYVGMEQFNARQRAELISLQQLELWIQQCHLYGVKIYLAANIVIFEKELEAAFTKIEQAILLGVDAIITQDIGLSFLLRKAFPSLKLHASTQTSIASSLDVNFYKKISFDRFILPRELSFEKISLLRKTIPYELEVFIHGSLCIAYSGQCFTSSGFGGRSANRGECAQSCRRLYVAEIDGKVENHIPAYYVSPNDLRADHLALPLSELGINALKIEGRLKSAAYVSAAVRSLRKQLDVSSENNSAEAIEKNNEKNKTNLNLFAKNENADRLTFLRGNASGWLGGGDSKNLVFEKFNNHLGMAVGKIAQISENFIQVVLTDESVVLQVGDGIAFFLPRVADVAKNLNKARTFDFNPTERIGTNIYKIELLQDKQKSLKAKNAGKTIKIFFSKDFQTTLRKTFSLHSPVSLKNQTVYLTSSPAVEKMLHNSFQNKQLHKKIAAFVKVQVKRKEKIFMELTDEEQNYVSVRSKEIVQTAQKRALTREQITEQFSKDKLHFLRLQHLEIVLDEQAFFPLGELKKLRQQLVEQVKQKRKTFSPNSSSAYSSPVHLSIKTSLAKVQENSKTVDSAFFPDEKYFVSSKKKQQETQERKITQPFMNILLRHPNQVKILLQQKEHLSMLKQSTVYLDFIYTKNMYRSIEMSLELLRKENIAVGIATERMLTDDDSGKQKQLDDIASLQANRILIRSAGAAWYLQQKKNFNGELVADYSLNITNSATANFFLENKFSLLTPSYDLFLNNTSNMDVSHHPNKNTEKKLKQGQLLFDMLEKTHPPYFEIILSSYLPGFYMEYCLYAKLLGQGGKFPECKVPCLDHRIELIDHVNEKHPLWADRLCRNTMFNGKRKEFTSLVQKLKQLGVEQYRIEFLPNEENLFEQLQYYQKIVENDVS